MFSINLEVSSLSVQLTCIAVHSYVWSSQVILCVMCIYIILYTVCYVYTHTHACMHVCICVYSFLLVLLWHSKTASPDI